MDRPERRLAILSRRRGDDGFSLIELLVVIIIIGILAAIAIPIYLSQRGKAQDAAERSDLHELSEFEEAYLASNNSYTGTFSNLDNAGDVEKVSPGDTVTIVWYSGANGYCLSASQSSSPDTIYYDSLAGGFLPVGATGCPTPGGGITTTPGQSRPPN